MDPKGLRGDIGGDRGMPVAVAPDPRAEAEERRHRRRLEIPEARRALAGQDGAEDAVVPRREAVDRLVEDDHRGPDLVDRARHAATQLGRPPQHRDLLAELAPKLTIGGGREPRIIGAGQEPGDPAQRNQDGPATGLGRVRREHRRDAQPLERRGVVESAERHAEPRALRGARRGTGSPGGAPHAVAGLREIDQLEVQPEGPNDALERRRVDRQDVEGDPRVGTAPAGGDGPEPGGLDELEHLPPGLLDDDLAEQRAEQPDLAGEHVARARRPDAPGLGARRIPSRALRGGMVRIELRGRTVPTAVSRSRSSPGPRRRRRRSTPCRRCGAARNPRSSGCRGAVPGRR